MRRDVISRGDDLDEPRHVRTHGDGISRMAFVHPRERRERAERAEGAFVVSRQRAMRVVLLKTPRLPPGYKGKRAWHLFAVGCPPADENPLKLENCFVRRRRPTYVFVVTRASFVGIGFSAGRGVLSYS